MFLPHPRSGSLLRLVQCVPDQCLASVCFPYNHCPRLGELYRMDDLPMAPRQNLTEMIALAVRWPRQSIDPLPNVSTLRRDAGKWRHLDHVEFLPLN